MNTILHRHRIDIIETTTGVEATITNLDTGNRLVLTHDLSLYETTHDLASRYTPRDDMLAELWCGSEPNLRDTYDTV